MGTTVLSIIILYFTWYKHLPPSRSPEDLDEDPQMSLAPEIKEAA